MIDFTCDCGNSYNELTGDLDERICNDCLDLKLYYLLYMKPYDMPDFSTLSDENVETLSSSFGFSRWKARKAFGELKRTLSKCFGE